MTEKKERVISLFTEAGAKLIEGIKLLDPSLEDDENFIRTDERFAKGFFELIEGTGATGEELDVTFKEGRYDEMITVGPICVVTVCPHHLLPVIMSIHVGYIPKEKVVGLSKLVRVARRLAHRAVLQEKLTRDIVDEITNKLRARGAICFIKAWHACMFSRGVKEMTPVTTSAVTGIFLTEPTAKDEFFKLLEQTKNSSILS